MGIKDFLNCAPMLLFPPPMKLKAFRVTHNDTTKMVKKHLPLLIICHIFRGTRLLYIVNNSRPELSNAVHEHSKCMDIENMIHYKYLLCEIKLLINTR